MNTTRREFMKMVGVGGAMGLPLGGQKPPPHKQAKRPNIIWLISEDNSVHYSKLYVPYGAETPNIAKLASQGVIYNHAFANCPVCSAARTTLITGCYAPRIGTQFHRPLQPATLPAGLKPFPAYLKAAGYHTSCLRKTDFNFATDLEGLFDSKQNWAGRKPNQPFFHQHQFAITHESRAQAAGRKGRDKKNVHLPPYLPNTPVFRRTINHYQQLHRQLDRHVGKVIARLQAEGVLEDTFIFYFGDHGGVAPRSKGYLYETGLHVPLVLRIPKNYAHLLDVKAGTRVDGFVNFIDFAPTALALAGLPVPPAMDGRPFLGPKVEQAEVDKRDESLGFADRFDEKYDLVRSLRKGRYKYLRSYQPFNFDGLQNNYRYKMVAYAELRKLFRAGKLNPLQSRFFLARPPEALYDLEEDPYEVHNLAADPKHEPILLTLRRRLAEKVKSLPDLSMYPESHLLKRALAAPVKFGQAKKGHIARLVDIADLSLLAFEKAKPGIAKALSAKNPWERYWGLISCSCFGKQASPFVEVAKTIAATDPELLTRTRAAEFLGLIGPQNPRTVIMDVLAKSTDHCETLLVLNTLVMLRDGKPGYTFPLDLKSIKSKGGLVPRRLAYLTGSPP